MTFRLTSITRNRVASSQRRARFHPQPNIDIDNCNQVYGETDCNHEPTCDENFGPPYCKKCGVML